MTNHKLNVIVFTNNDREATDIGFLLSQNNWEVALAWNERQFREYEEGFNTDAIVVILEDKEFLEDDLLKKLIPNYPVILIDNLPASKENKNWIFSLVDKGAYKVDHHKIQSELKRTILSSVLFYRSGEMTA
ncbi:hypothetical protein [Bacteriovorax sp. BSW11_IV]|uniref:hypothetical protein n=1 Tax=Bacteriovorax sp. BSW11_IV TaxID=1353529 RepID=UPI0003F4BFD4|nr:hypothetical protein [Bacteriovorax sp. BSW11_IV]